MIARGQHIPTLNETAAIRKSADGTVLDPDDVPRNSGAGSATREDIRAFIRGELTQKKDIDVLMAKRQEGA
jgi:hypothetical protein